MIETSKKFKLVVVSIFFGFLFLFIFTVNGDFFHQKLPLEITLSGDSSHRDSERFKKYLQPLLEKRFDGKVIFKDHSPQSATSSFIVSIDGKNIEEITMNKMLTAINEALEKGGAL